MSEKSGKNVAQGLIDEKGRLLVYGVEAFENRNYHFIGPKKAVRITVEEVQEPKRKGDLAYYFDVLVPEFFKLFRYYGHDDVHTDLQARRKAEAECPVLHEEIEGLKGEKYIRVKGLRECKRKDMEEVVDWMFRWLTIEHDWNVISKEEYFEKVKKRKEKSK